MSGALGRPVKPKLTSAQVRDAKTVFDAIDTDKNGTLDLDELAHLLSHVGESVALAPLIMAIWDEDGNGQVDFNDFLRFYEVIESEGPPGADTITSLLFKRIDVDGDGQIDVAELIRFSHLMGMRMTADEAKQTIAALDKNEDGKISFADLVSTLGL